MKSGRPPMSIGKPTGPDPERMAPQRYRGAAQPSPNDEIVPAMGDGGRMSPGTGGSRLSPYENHLRHPSAKAFGQKCC